jgi:hypothetical protein
MGTALFVAAFLGAAVVSCGCCSSKGSTSASLPSPGTDAQFAGTYPGVFSYVASFDSTDGASGVVSSSLGVDDATTDPTLSPDGILLNPAAAPAWACVLPGNVNARRYDPSGGYAQLPLTIASASVVQGSRCTWPVEGGNAAFRVETSDVKLYADGSLELSVAGPIETWPSVATPNGTLEVTFFGQRPPAPVTP